MPISPAPPLLADLKQLLEVQVVDSALDRARATLAALDTGASTVAEFNIAKTEAEARKTAMIKAQAEQHDGEMKVETIDEKKKRDEKKMFSGGVTGARELENLQRELDMLGRQKNDAEERVLIAMEATAEAQTANAQADALVASLTARYRKIRAVYKERHAELSAEIAVLEAERKTVATPVSPPLLARYDAIRAKKKGVGAAPLGADESCGACHTKISSYLAVEVRAGTAVQVCEYCTRLLVPV